MGPLDELINMMRREQNESMKTSKWTISNYPTLRPIIQSMTQQERVEPSVINASRKKRIAKGSGTSVSQVNRLLKQFEEMKKMMKQMTSPKKGKREE